MFSILFAPLSPFGLILGAAAFVAALTPSMIPRPGVLQGVECGLAFALLYGLGTGASALWSWLQLPVAGDRYRRTFGWISILLCVALVGYGLVRETDWQNAIRRAMGMPPVADDLPVLIAIVSAPVALFLIGLARLFNALAMLISARLSKLVPRRIALLGGFGIAAALFWSIGSGLLLRTALHELDSSYRRIDALLPAEVSAPEDPSRAAAEVPHFVGQSGRAGARARGRGPIQERHFVADRRPRDGAIAGLCRPQLRRNCRSARGTGAGGADTHQRVRPLGAGDRDADGHRLGRSGGHGAARDPASRRRRVCLGAIFLLAELAFPAHRAGLWRRHGARRLSVSV